MFADLHHLSHHAAWRRQLEMLLESAGNGIYGVDLRGRCIFINRAGADLLGYSPDEVLGRNMHYLIHHTHASGALMDVHDCRIFKAYQEGKGCRVDDEVLWRRDGTAFPAEYASYPILNAETVVGAVVTFSDISERKQAEQQLQAAHDALESRVTERTAELSAAHDALRRLSSHLQSVREVERAHIARDIHDDLGASLTALKLDLDWLRRRLNRDSTLTAQVDRMLEVTGQAMGAVHRILNDLRPGVLEHLGLWAALESLLQDVQQRSGLYCRLDYAPGIEQHRLDREAEIAIYRIVQEALTNVQRHADASRIDVSVHAEVHTLVLCVRDDGHGMQAPTQPASFGLLGMRERAHALGGQLEWSGSPDSGTLICLRLPQALSGPDAPDALGD